MLNTRKGIFLSLVILGGVILGIYAFRTSNLYLDNNQVVYSEKTNKKDIDNIKIPGYSKISVPANQENVEITLCNPKGNKCYFKFELVIEGETIYTSGLVKEGNSINNLKLSKTIPKGEYNAIIKITPYSLDKSQTYNGANVKAKLQAF